MRITLLGPQRRPTLEAVARSLYPEGPIATITAGWQERESDDGELGRLLGSRDVNLGLYRRWLDVIERDPLFAAGERRLAEVLDEIQDSYLLRLDHALQAVYAVQRRGGNGSLRAGILAEAIGQVRDLDAAHLSRVGAIRGEFYAELLPHERPVIAEHRAEVAALLGDATALVMAGGHVGVLADVLHLFNVAASLRAPVIAWSAGAMALAERIVLFHDRSAPAFWPRRSARYATWTPRTCAGSARSVASSTPNCRRTIARWSPSTAPRWPHCSVTPPPWCWPAGMWACWPTCCTCSTSRRPCVRR